MAEPILSPDGEHVLVDGKWLPWDEWPGASAYMATRASTPARTAQTRGARLLRRVDALTLAQRCFAFFLVVGVVLALDYLLRPLGYCDYCGSALFAKYEPGHHLRCRDLVVETRNKGFGLLALVILSGVSGLVLFRAPQR